jgi:predicted TIM-barrel fold metal-dependent hydrolase
MNKIDEKVVFGSDFPEISIKEHLTYIQHKSEFYKFDLSKLCSTNIIKILNHE